MSDRKPHRSTHVTRTTRSAESVSSEAKRTHGSRKLPAERIAHAEATLAGECNCCVDNTFSFSLGSDVSKVAPFVDELTGKLATLLNDSGQAMRIAGAVNEGLMNAVIHGNLEVSSELKESSDAHAFLNLVRFRTQQPPFCSRMVQVDVRLDARAVCIRIRDEGPGFDPRDVKDPTQFENLELPSGRGLLLMRAFMDEVRFNDRGNEVTLIKQLDAAPPTN